MIYALSKLGVIFLGTPCRYNKKLSYFAYGLALTNIVLYIRFVRIWYSVRISIDYRSYIVRIYRVNENVNSTVCATFLNIAKYFKTMRCGCNAVALFFSIYFKPVLFLVHVKKLSVFRVVIKYKLLLPVR